MGSGLRTRIAAVVAALALPLAAHAAQTLYATSLRGEASGSTFVAGNLYNVDPATAASRLIGPIRVGDAAVGIAAVAAHPKTGVFYGMTAGLSTHLPRSLVTIDLDSARAVVVAKLATRGSDISFAPDGTLYMWAPDLHQVVKVDLATGETTPIGSAPIDGTAGGIAIDSSGHRAIVAVSGATGHLDFVDLETGVAAKGPSLSGAPHAASIDNLAYSPDGVLFAVNSNGGAPSTAALVTIDEATGTVKRIGSLPDDTRGLIFARERETPRSWEAARKWILIALGVVAVALMLVAANLK